MSKRPDPPSPQQIRPNQKQKTTDPVTWPSVVDDAVNLRTPIKVVDNSDLAFLLRVVSAESTECSTLKLGQAEELVEEREDLRANLLAAYARKQYGSIVAQVIKIVGKPATSRTTSRDELLSNDLIGTYKAFQAPYEGESHLTLIKTMEYYLNKKELDQRDASDGVYNFSVPIFQSSGMGKSRLVDMAAQLRIAFPFNLRDRDDHRSYPPSDNVVLRYLLPTPDLQDTLAQAKYIAFLAAVFIVATEIFDSNHFYESPSPAKAWYDYLAHDQKANHVGPNRNQFNENVISCAKQLFESDDRKDSNEQLVNTLEQSCRRFLARLPRKDFLNKESLQTGCFFYFDEAHTLTHPRTEDEIKNGHSRSAYSNLGAVLGRLNHQPVFFLFLSTNSRVESLAPAMRHYPSLRERSRILLPPHTELPFDIFANQLFSRLKQQGAVTLNRVCTTKTIAHFGRPLWYSGYLNGRDDVLEFAASKLASSWASLAENADYAALSSRILLFFNSEVEEARRRESKLVESHLRVVFAVPEHREFMRAGSPSEPIVAEAAARLLDPYCEGAIKSRGPDILAKALAKGFLARGERGELVARLLITIAHDLVAAELQKNHPSEAMEPKFHRPIPFVSFLKSLFHEKWHKVILSAMPLGSDPNSSMPSQTLEEAFQNTYLNFSHFALADDFEATKLEHSWKALIRGFAFQAANNQASFDLLNHIFFGDPNTTEISKLVAALLQWQIKNREDTHEVFVNPTINDPNTDLPIVSIVLELGCKEKHGITVQRRLPPSTRQTTAAKELNKKHYVIVVRGATADIFNAISNDREGTYQSLLAATKTFDDFPRSSRDFPDNRKEFYRLKSAFAGKEEMCHESWGWAD